MIKTFSANSLKLLEKNIKEYKQKYEQDLYFASGSDSARLGEKLHALICYKLKKFNLSKFETALDNNEKILWENLRANSIFNKNYIKIEESFLVKFENYCLTGRFDAVYKENDSYVIIDWKTTNIPKHPQDDLQSVVYLLCGSYIFKTEKISLLYFSLKEQKQTTVRFENGKKYLDRIEKIISLLK